MRAQEVVPTLDQAEQGIGMPLLRLDHSCPLHFDYAIVSARLDDLARDAGLSEEANDHPPVILEAVARDEWRFS